MKGPDINAQIGLAHSSVDAANKRLGYIDQFLDRNDKMVLIEEAQDLLIQAKKKLELALERPV